MCGLRISLSALVSVGLRHRVSQLHLELVAAQRRLSVMADEAVEAVEHQVVRQVKTGGARLLTGVDPAVLDPAGTPAGRCRNSWLADYLFIYLKSGKRSILAPKPTDQKERV